MEQSQRKERFEMRISPAHKELIAAAASLSGKSLTDFARGVLVEQATQLIEQNERTRLTLRDRDRFLEILDDEEPNEALRAAARRFLADE